MYSSKHKQKPARACLISTPHDSSAEQIRWCHSLEMSSLRRPGPSTACEGLRGASHCSLYDHSSHTTLAFAHPLCPQLWECHLPSSLCGMHFPQRMHVTYSPEYTLILLLYQLNLPQPTYIKHNASLHTYVLVAPSLLDFSWQHLFQLRYYQLEWNLKRTDVANC